MSNRAIATAPAATLAPAAGQGLRPAVVNMYLTGCNINNGGQQIIGHSNTQVGHNTYGGADLQAETIRAQAATIAAQQRTIDRLISMLEQRTPGQL